MYHPTQSLGMPVISRVLIMVPTAQRLGFFAPVTILFIGAIIFYMSFQPFFFDLSYSLTTDLYFDQYVLDTWCVTVLPADLLFMFFVSQLRIRMGWYWLNFWSIFHTIMSCGTAAMSILYIIGRAEEVFSIITSSYGSSQEMENIVKFLISLQTQQIRAMFNDPNSAGYKFCMYLCTYLFILEFFLALIFTTVGCSMFGSQQIIVAIKKENGQYAAVVEGRASRRKIREAKVTKKNTRDDYI